MSKNEPGNLIMNNEAAKEGATTGGASELLMSAWEKLNAADMTEASALFKAAIAAAESQFEAGSAELSDLYTDASTGLFLAGAENYADAINLLELAIAARTSRDGELSVETGRVHRQISSMKKTSHDYAGAVESMRKSIDIFEALEAYGHSSNPEELRQMYSDLRELHSRADDAAVEAQKKSGVVTEPEDPLELRSCVIDDDDETSDDEDEEEKRHG